MEPAPPTLTGMAETDPELLDPVRVVCLALPEVEEQAAWIGHRWRIRGRTFAHVFTVDAGDETKLMPPGCEATGGTALSFRADGEELAALEQAGPPFWRTRWGRNAVGLVLGPDTDWTEVAELLTDSYCVMAPRRLADRVAGHVGTAD